MTCIIAPLKFLSKHWISLVKTGNRGFLSVGFCSNITRTPGSGVTNDTPTGGDTNANSDMDDGVSFPNNIRPNITVQFPVTIFNNTGNDAYLSAWVDWNGDGDFDDAGEEIAAANAYPFATNSGTFMTSLSVNVPATAVKGQDIGVRFRLSSVPAAIASPCGSTVCAADGEIEDYLIQVECPPAICLPPTIQINQMKIVCHFLQWKWFCIGV